MRWLELQDIMFLVKSLKEPSNSVNLEKHVTFLTSKTRAGHSGNYLRVRSAKFNFIQDISTMLEL